MLPVTSKGNAGLAVAMPTSFATESTVSMLESMFTLPVTVKEPKAPTLVMLGCAAVVMVPARDVALTFPANRFPVTTRFATFDKGPYVTLPVVGYRHKWFSVAPSVNPVNATWPPNVPPNVPPPAQCAWMGQKGHLGRALTLHPNGHMMAQKK